jgi:dolichyl-phosphate beta-glucosyltransferase
MRLSVIIPAYNEEKCLAKNVGKFAAYLERQLYDYEIIIVNDGSVDRTGEIARRLKKTIRGLRIIEMRKNQGKGAAVREGLAAAAGKWRLFLDADNATTIDHIEKAWPLLDRGCDIVIGSRNPNDAPGAAQVIRQPRWKRTMGIIGNRLIRLLAVSGISDTQCGFKIFSARAAREIVPRMSITRWGFDVEMLVIGRGRGYKIAAIPVKWRNSFDSRVGITGYIETLKDLAKIKINALSGRYK